MMRLFARSPGKAQGEVALAHGEGFWACLCQGLLLKHNACKVVSVMHTDRTGVCQYGRSSVVKHVYM